MMWKIIKIIFVLVFLGFCCIEGAKLPFDLHIKIYDTLLTASGILFGVFGLWVSVLYPSVLYKSLKESGQTETPEDISNKANQLLEPMFFSLVLFLVMISVEFIAPLLRILNWPYSIRLLSKSISAGVASIIFIMLLQSIFRAMNQTEVFQTLITRNAILTDMKNRFISGICRTKK